MIKKVFFLILIILLYVLLKKNNIEDFVDGNFKLCEENDCDCLKLKTAPDGTCVKYKIATKPETPEYENKKLYMNHVVRNNLYPLKRNLDILIFVGKDLKNEKKKYTYSPPNILGSINTIEKEKHSSDPKTQNLYLVFQKANRILSYFNKDSEPYLKYLILDLKHGGKTREILKSYKISNKVAPVIYLINEANKEKKYFKCDPEEDKCYLLKKLLIFIANGDLGLISYLNHLHDPFSGVEFRHDSKKNEWYPKNPGIKVHDEGTEMCKLIDYRDLPEDLFKKVDQLENSKK